MIKTEIINLQSFSTNFPTNEWESMLERPQFIQLLEDSLIKNDLLFLSGEEGLGKTTVLAQFCNRFGLDCISVFFNPFHINDLTVAFLRTEIVNQISFYLDKSISAPDLQYANTETFQMSIHSLKRKLKPKRKPIYFIIDGLENRKNTDIDNLNKILKDLPLGDNTFKFVISGSARYFKEKFPDIQRLNYQELSMPPLTTDQIIAILGKSYELLTTRPEILETTRGYPSRLDVLKRLIDRDPNLDNILEDYNFQNWIELDCQVVNLEDLTINKVFSLISFSEYQHTVEEMSSIAQVDIALIKEIINDNPLLRLRNGFLEMPSESHVKYFKNLLRSRKSTTQDLLMSYYALAETIQDKFRLSKLLKSKGDHKGVTDLIDGNFIKAAVELTGSLEIVNESINYGFEASTILKEYSKTFQFSLQSGLVKELDNYLFWETEILARISLGDFKGAVELAEKAVLNIDRLRLLSLIARKEKEINKRVDEELISTIRHLYSITNLNQRGDVIYDVVANLIYAIPNLAIEMIEKSAGEVTDRNINDWVIAKLSVAAVNAANDSDEPNSKELNNKALEKLNNPSTRKIQRAIEFLVGNYSANKVLTEIKSLKDSGERIKLLRLWLKNNKTHKAKIGEVIQKTLDELISSSTDSDVIINVLVDLSEQLVRITDQNEKEKLLNMFKNFDQKTLNRGQIQQTVQYELNIINAYHSFRRDKAEHLIEILIRKIDEFNDDLIKIEAYGKLYQKLAMWKNYNLKNHYHRVYREILNLGEKLLSNTAYHEKITENLIINLGKVDIKFGLLIIKGINTSYNRNSAILKLIDSYLDNNLKFVNTDSLYEVLEAFESSVPKEIAIQRILERFSDSKSLPEKRVIELIPLIEKIKHFDSQRRKIESQLSFIKVCAKNSKTKSRLWSSQCKTLLNYWEDTDKEWQLIHYGYYIASEISLIDKEKAKMVFEETTLRKNEVWLDSKSLAYTYIAGLRLIIKAYSGLIKNGIATTKHYDHLEKLIGRIISSNEKLLLWSEVAFSSILFGDMQVLKKIYDNHILPIITDPSRTLVDRAEIADAYVILYYMNNKLALQHMQTLTDYTKEEICVKLIDFYIQKRNPFENYTGEIVGYISSYDDILKAVDVLHVVSTDSLLYFQLKSIASSIEKTKTLTSPQRSDLIQRLKAITSDKLPDIKNINHDGYVILCNLHIANIEKSSLSRYEELSNQSDLIPNLSDKLFTKSEILEDLPWNRFNKSSVIKSNLNSYIVSNLPALPSNFEYLERVLSLTPVMLKRDKNRWKKVLNEAFKISFQMDDDVEMQEYQRRILDSVHKIDSDFSNELLKITYSESQKWNSDMLSEFHAGLEMGKKILNNQTLDEIEKSEYRRFVSGVYKTLGSLNAGKCATRSVATLTNYLDIGRKIPLTEAFPIHQFFIANLNNYNIPKNTKSGIPDLQESIFESIYDSLKLIELLAQKRKSIDVGSNRNFLDNEFQESLIIKPNSREEAFQHIRNWILEEAEGFLTIVDPYLVKEDLDLLKFIQEKEESIKINYLSCRKLEPQDQDEFERYWNDISDQEPPFTNLTFFYLSENPSFKIIHDRWIISKNGGLRLGTSINSIGLKKISEISVITPNVAMDILNDNVNQYLNREATEFDSQKIRYSNFSL